MLGCSLLQTPPAGSWLSLRLSRAGLLTEQASSLAMRYALEPRNQAPSWPQRTGSEAHLLHASMMAWHRARI